MYVHSLLALKSISWQQIRIRKKDQIGRTFVEIIRENKATTSAFECHPKLPESWLVKSKCCQLLNGNFFHPLLYYFLGLSQQRTGDLKQIYCFTVLEAVSPKSWYKEGHALKCIEENHSMPLLASLFASKPWHSFDWRSSFHSLPPSSHGHFYIILPLCILIPNFPLLTRTWSLWTRGPPYSSTSS